MNFKLRNKSFEVGISPLGLILNILLTTTLGAIVLTIVSDKEANPFLFGMGLWLSIVILAFIHEMGHVVGYKIFGYRWTNLNISFMKYSVSSNIGRPPHKQQIIISLLGPVFGGLGSLAMLMTVTIVSSYTDQAEIEGILTNPALYAGYLGLLVNAINLLIPYSRKTDSGKIFVAVSRMIRGKSHLAR